jgi:radical SAM enzyme (TIGR01210 family)
MSKNHEAIISKNWIISSRGNKNSVDPNRPYAWLVEKERTSSGKVEDTAIIFLTNSECSFQCLMCDLWKNTTDKPNPVGAIPDQIEWALAQMPQVKHVKLYNSGSFFDEKAIPESDYNRIASLLECFETVIVESHPKLVNQKCLRFRDFLKPKLEVALGLEIVHPGVLLKLNKRMTLSDFKTSVNFLKENEIGSRAFILLRPPFLTETEGVLWAKKSIDYAFDAGIECCTVIPVRAGNGAMDKLIENGDFSMPKIQSLETVLEYGIGLGSGRVFADVWDLGLFSNCDHCVDQRIDRINSMNLSQQMSSQVVCTCDRNES